MPVHRLKKRARFALDESLEMAWQLAALSLAGRFKRAPRLLCGPEVRTRQTAMLFGEHPQVEEALRDCDVGRWQGRSLEELQQAEPDAVQAWLTDGTAKPHGGESVAQLCERVGRWLHSLEQVPGHVLAVTHPFVIQRGLGACPAMSACDVQPDRCGTPVIHRAAFQWHLALAPGNSRHLIP